MRIDKLTTKFQQALAEAQSQALAHDNGYIEPQHVLAALLAQEDGGTVSLLQRAGANVAGLRKALTDSIARLPKVEGTGGVINRATCTEQMLYELHDPANYITPDVVAVLT